MMIEHGRIGTYRSGCRCDLCRAENARLGRLHMQRRRAPGYVADKVKSAAGQSGARKRWADTVSTRAEMKDLTVTQRRSIHAQIAMMRAENEALDAS